MSWSLRSDPKDRINTTVSGACFSQCVKLGRGLVFNEAAKGNVDGTLERIAHCVEVYERYPGLCRCIMRW